MEKKASVTNFSEINSPQDLIAYLSDSANRLENTKNKTAQYVYHYTKLSNVVSIINNVLLRYANRNTHLMLVFVDCQLEE